MSMKMTHTIGGIAATLLIILGLVFVFFYTQEMRKQNMSPENVLSYEDCVDAGYPVSEMQPPRCTTPDGRTYAKEIAPDITYVNADADMITVELPFPGAVTGTEFAIVGKARGQWFSEGVFPITILDSDGQLMAKVIARAESDWMTTEFVPFRAYVMISGAYAGNATLVLEKDNPSGLEENAASMSFPFAISF